MIQIVPAYGRVYLSKAEVETALADELDFEVCDMFHKWDGAKCNRSDLRNDGHTEVKVRYGKGLAKTGIFKIGV